MMKTLTTTATASSAAVLFHIRFADDGRRRGLFEWGRGARPVQVAGAVGRRGGGSTGGAIGKDGTPFRFGAFDDLHFAQRSEGDEMAGPRCHKNKPVPQKAGPPSRRGKVDVATKK